MGGLVNALMVRWSGGTTWEEDAPSIAANGRREQVLKLPGITSAAQATEVARAVLDLRANARTRTTAGHLPATGTDEPFTAYNLGDLVTAPGPDGAPVDLRVQSITVNERDDGELEFSPELGSRIDELEDALARFLAKFGTAPATENGSSSGGDASPYDPGPDYTPIPPTEPDPVPPIEPYEQPVIDDPTITGGSSTGQQIDDPTIGNGNVIGTVYVNGPEGEDPAEIKIGDDDGEGAGGKLTVEENGELETKPGSSSTLRGNVEIGDEGIVFTKGASPEDLTLGTMWDKVRGIWGKLTGGKAGAETTIDALGNMKFGQDGVNRPTIDFTDADVLGLGGGGGCVDTTTPTDSGVYINCTDSPPSPVIQFARSVDVGAGFPDKGGYILGNSAAGGGAVEVGATNSATGKYCYIAGQAGSGYLELGATDFIELFAFGNVIVFEQIHPSYSGGSPTGRFAWHFDYDGTDWFIVDNSNLANVWQISN